MFPGEKNEMSVRCRSLLHWFAVLVMCTAGTTVPADPIEVNPTYKVHMLSKPAVVRILDGAIGFIPLADGRKVELQSISSGSGFFVSPDGYIMTNAHVVSMTKSGDEGIRQELFKQFILKALASRNMQPTQENVAAVLRWAQQNAGQVTLTTRANFVLLQDGNKLRYEIKSYGAPMGEEGGQLTGKDVAILKVETRNAPTLRLGDSARMRVGDRVFVIGFPGAADSDLLDNRSSVEPTTNDGSISAVKTTVDGIPVLQTNTNTTHGNSGGPVLNQNAEVIGLLTFRGNTVNGQEVQGFNFIVPSNTAREYLGPAGTTNTAGLVDQGWSAGLEQYWAGHFRTAKTKFEEVVSLQPNHAEARRLITETQERILRGEEKPDAPAPAPLPIALTPPAPGPATAPVPTPAPAADGTGTTLIIAIAAIAVLIVIAVAVLLLRNRGGQPAPTTRAPYAGPSLRGGTAHLPAYAGDSAATMFGAPGGSTGEARLNFTAGPLSGQNISIPASGAWLGRDASRADILVSHPMVSGQHLWIGRQGERWLLKDKGSTNGTYIGSSGSGRVSEHPLRNGDRVLIAPDGAVSFTVSL